MIYSQPHCLGFLSLISPLATGVNERVSDFQEILAKKDEVRPSESVGDLESLVTVKKGYTLED